VLIAYTIAYVFVLIAVVMCTVELRARQFLHATYKIFIVSVILQELGIMLQLAAYAKYASVGEPFPRLKNLGKRERYKYTLI